MCTVSVIFPPDQPGLFRVVSNRDEQRSRPPATPPTWHAIKGGATDARALWPTDTLAGGTWIAAAQHGLVLAILNLNPNPPVSVRGVRGLLSRGSVIPALIGQRDAAAAMEGLRKLPLDRFAPFRLVAVNAVPLEAGSPALNSGRVLEARWDRRDFSVHEHHGPAVCFTSSGLGDHTVQDRLTMFDRSIATATISAIAQDEFHSHQWPDRPGASVRMSREDARTVSVAAVTVARADVQPNLFRISMDYRTIEDTAAKRASA